MKTSTWVVLACAVVIIGLVGCMLGLWAVPTTEQETAPATSTTSTVSSASGGGSAKNYNEPAETLTRSDENRGNDEPAAELNGETRSDDDDENKTTVSGGETEPERTGETDDDGGGDNTKKEE